MTTITVIEGVDKLKRKLEAYGADVVRSSVRALNRTIEKGRTEASRAIRDEVNLPAGYVKERLGIKKATFGDLRASITTPKRGILLSRFPHTVLKGGRGVAVRVKKGGRKVLAGAFIIPAKAGDKAVPLIVLRSAGRYANRSAKVRALYGPSPSQVFQNVKQPIEAKLGEDLLEQLRRQVREAMRKAAK